MLGALVCPRNSRFQTGLCNCFLHLGGNRLVKEKPEKQKMKNKARRKARMEVQWQELLTEQGYGDKESWRLSSLSLLVLITKLMFCLRENKLFFKLTSLESYKRQKDLQSILLLLSITLSSAPAHCSNKNSVPAAPQKLPLLLAGNITNMLFSLLTFFHF